MRLNGKLEKLERAAKSMLKCDWCKFSLRDMSPDEEDKAKAAPGNYVKAKCTWCGTEVTYDVSKYNRRELELFLIFKNHSCDGSMYRNERVYAAHAWSVSMRELPGANAFAKLATLPPDELRKVLEERFGRKPGSNRQPARPEKPDKYAQERAELKRKAGEFAAQMYKEERDKHGPIQHNLGREVEALETILPENCGAGSWEIKTPESAARKLLYHARVVEKCEVRLWGRARRSVRQMIEFAAPIIQAAEDKRAQEKREREEREREREEAAQRRRAMM